MKPLIAILLVVTTTPSQDARPTAGGQAYRIPFASQGNTIELTIANTAAPAASQVFVEAVGAPSWISFSQKTIALDGLTAKQQKAATFSFSVDRLAPVGEEESLTFRVKTKSGESWAKEIKIQTVPPEKFEPFQSYPNPFNPTTTICYQLTNDSSVSLKVYNLLGQEVATLVDEQQQVGYHQEVFDASRFASGMYIYRIVYANEAGKLLADRKTMMLLK
jgi:hypothetical protein